MPADYETLPPFDPDDNTLNAVIETPKGSRNKFDYEPKRGLFKLGGVLAAGMSFPFDFGFVPGTRGDDGDPLDVLVLMDEPAFAGCLVPARLIGVIEADQTEQNGHTDKNDRLVAVAHNSRNHKNVHVLDDLSPNLVHEIEHFFVAYNDAKGKQFRLTGRGGPNRARQLVDQGAERFAAPHP